MLFLQLITGCSQKKERATDEDVVAIKQFFSEWKESLNTGDAIRLAARYIEDGIEMPPGRSRLGKDAIHARFQSVFEKWSGDVVDLSIDEILVLDGWAFVRTQASIKWTSVDESDTRVENSKGLAVLKRQPDGTWKIARNMWNRNEIQPQTQ